MFVDICTCYKYYFQDFDLKINPLTLKVIMNHRHNTIKDLQVKIPIINEKEVVHMFLALFGKNHIFAYFNIDVGFCPLAPPPS